MLDARPLHSLSGLVLILSGPLPGVLLLGMRKVHRVNARGMPCLSTPGEKKVKKPPFFEYNSPPSCLILQTERLS